MCSLIGINPIAIFFPHAPLPAMWCVVSRLIPIREHKPKPPPTCFPPKRKRDAARKELRNIFGAVIDNRRKHGIQHDDMLQAFMQAEYKDGMQEIKFSLHTTGKVQSVYQYLHAICMRLQAQSCLMTPLRVFLLVLYLLANTRLRSLLLGLLSTSSTTRK